MKVDLLLAPAIMVALLLLALGCQGTPDATAVPAPAEPRIIEWTIGPQGGLGGPGAFITKHVWEPRELEVPVNYPFIIRFTPRDDTKDTIRFGNSLKEEIGIDLPNLVVEGGQPQDSPVLIIKEHGRSFDVASREHRGTGGYGTLITPAQ
jgi:hypothetical protein